MSWFGGKMLLCTALVVLFCGLTTAAMNVLHLTMIKLSEAGAMRLTSIHAVPSSVCRSHFFFLPSSQHPVSAQFFWWSDFRSKAEKFTLGSFSAAVTYNLNWLRRASIWRLLMAQHSGALARDHQATINGEPWISCFYSCNGEGLLIICSTFGSQAKMCIAW